jgi:hypothetical protein
LGALTRFGGISDVHIYGDGPIKQIHVDALSQVNRTIDHLELRDLYSETPLRCPDGCVASRKLETDEFRLSDASLVSFFLSEHLTSIDMMRDFCLLTELSKQPDVAVRIKDCVIRAINMDLLPVLPKVLPLFKSLEHMYLSDVLDEERFRETLDEDESKIYNYSCPSTLATMPSLKNLSIASGFLNAFLQASSVTELWLTQHMESNDAQEISAILSRNTGFLAKLEKVVLDVQKTTLVSTPLLSVLSSASQRLRSMTIGLEQLFEPSVSTDASISANRLEK